MQRAAFSVQRVILAIVNAKVGGINNTFQRKQYKIRWHPSSVLEQVLLGTTNLLLQQPNIAFLRDRRESANSYRDLAAVPDEQMALRMVLLDRDAWDNLVLRIGHLVGS